MSTQRITTIHALVAIVDGAEQLVYDDDNRYMAVAWDDESLDMLRGAEPEFSRLAGQELKLVRFDRTELTQ